MKFHFASRVRTLEIKVAKLMGEPPPAMTVKVSTADIERIKKIVCKYFGVTLESLNGKCRNATLTWPRHAAIYFCLRYTPHSANLISKAFNRDHQLMPYAAKKIQNRCETEPEFCQRIAECEALVRKAMKG